MTLSEAERLFNKRDIEGKMLLVSLKLIGTETLLRPNDQIHPALRELIKIRAIDLFSIKDICKTCAEAKELFQDFLHEILGESLDVFFPDLKDNTKHELILNIKNKFGGKIHPAGNSNSKYSDIILSRNGQELVLDIETRIRRDNSYGPADNLKKMMAKFTLFLCNISWHIYGDRAQCFLIIRDKSFLRRILLPANINCLFDDIYIRKTSLRFPIYRKSLSSSESYSTITDGYGKKGMRGVLLSYLGNYKKYIITDLRTNKGSMLLSGRNKSFAMVE